MYLGRAARTKETLPDFRERCRVARHSRVFRELMGSQRTPGFWGVIADIKFSRSKMMKRTSPLDSSREI